MKNGMKELTPEMMENVSGGIVVEDKEKNEFWIVRQDGSVIAPAPSLEQALEFAKAFNVSLDVMTKQEYAKHYGRELVW